MQHSLECKNLLPKVVNGVSQGRRKQASWCDQPKHPCSPNNPALKQRTNHTAAVFFGEGVKKFSACVAVGVAAGCEIAAWSGSRISQRHFIWLSDQNSTLDSLEGPFLFSRLEERFRPTFPSADMPEMDGRHRPATTGENTDQPFVVLREVVSNTLDMNDSVAFSLQDSAWRPPRRTSTSWSARDRSTRMVSLTQATTGDGETPLRLPETSVCEKQCGGFSVKKYSRSIVIDEYHSTGSDRTFFLWQISTGKAR